MKLKLISLSKCPSCGAEERKPLFDTEGSRVFLCLKCRLKYLDPCLDPDAMKHAYESEETLKSMHDFHEGYYEYGSLDTPSRTLQDFQKGLDLIEKTIGGKENILDVGFGNGFFLAAAQKRGWAVQGIDSSSANLEAARRKFDLELIQSSWEDFQTSEKFDAITFWDLLEHFHTPNSALQKIRTHLKPGGAVLFAVPNDQSFLTFLASVFYRLGFKKNLQKIYLLEHVCYYRLETLTSLLKRNGFRLSASFQTSTDLKKYNLPFHEKLIASCVLLAGLCLGRQNRLVAVFQKI